jgi:Fe-S cluster biogenesis protein NfuA
MTTKRVIERSLKERVAPDICVVNVEPGYESMLPDDIYRGG